jgi:hypothetical protein
MLVALLSLTEEEPLDHKGRKIYVYFPFSSATCHLSSFHPFTLKAN